MKRLTLDETWKLCLKQWCWVIKKDRDDDADIIEILKKEWVKEHGFKNVFYNCFFCEYSFQKVRNLCGRCPAKKIDKDFDCECTDYGFVDKPIEFYKKLVQLNKLRLAKKRMKYA